MASQVESIKWVPGTRLMVDGFAFVNSKCNHYFLTHMHSDHTVGLTRSFQAGTIYCSPISARLLALEWGLHAPVVKVLHLDQPTVVDGVSVTAIDANHCPGAVMLLFEVPKADGENVTQILHTGDCRWQDGLRANSCLAHKQIDILMLDTTYAAPRHTFPPQTEAIAMMVQVMREALTAEPSTLFVMGSYHIGKERAYLNAAEALGLKVYVSPAKRRVLELLDLPGQHMALLTADPRKALVHVKTMGVAPDKLQAYLDGQDGEWKQVIGFRPTGWSFRRSGGLQCWREGCIAMYGVPYSEHSSWTDLRSCVASLKPKKVIPTVNASSPIESAALVEQFIDLMDLRRNKGRMDVYLIRKCSAANSNCSTQLHESASHIVTPDTNDRQLTEAASGAIMHSSGTSMSLVRCPAGAAAAKVAVEALNPTAICNLHASHNADNSAIALGAPVSVLQDLTVSDALQEASASSSQVVPLVSDAAASAQDSAAAIYSGALQPLQDSATAGSCLAGVSFDLASVDIIEQQRILENAQRLQRLRHSVQLQMSAKAAAKKRRKLCVA